MRIERQFMRAGRTASDSIAFQHNALRAAALLQCDRARTDGIGKFMASLGKGVAGDKSARDLMVAPAPVPAERFLSNGRPASGHN